MLLLPLLEVGAAVAPVTWGEVAGVVGAGISLLVTLVGFLAKRTYETERAVAERAVAAADAKAERAIATAREIQQQVVQALGQAHQTTSKIVESQRVTADARMLQVERDCRELVLERERHGARLNVLERDCAELSDTDKRQERRIDRVEARLDRGQRTLSGQLDAARVAEDDSDPPPRPRLPSRAGK